MDQIHIICEDSPEGIFTAIYYAYEKHYSPESTHIETGENVNMCLFVSYDKVDNDSVKAEKVMRTLKQKFGEETYMILCQAVSAGCTIGELNKADAVYHTIAIGLKLKCPCRVMEQLANPNVLTVMKLSRNVGGEAHHLIGFLRFEELEEGILYAQYQSVNNVLMFMMPHFEDRFPNENFMICDRTRKLIGIHPAGKPWFLLSDDEVKLEEDLAVSDRERMYRELFTYFCKRITIEARENLKLQRNMLPLRFRKYMVEF